MRRPIIQVFKGGTGGTDLMPSMAPYFLSGTLVDEVGLENDEFTLELDDEARQLPLPKKDDLLTVVAGYVETGTAVMGEFKVQGWGSGWDEGGVELMRMTARAATFTGDVKAGGAKHWDDQTLGAILRESARAAGLQLAIDPALASVKVPYALRWESSPIDFATRLAEEHGAFAKPGGGRLSVVLKGSGKGAGGTQLPVIQVRRRGSNGWWIDGEPRPQHGEVAASWIDPKDGRRKVVKESTGREGPLHNMIHPRATEGEAKAAAKAQVRALNMAAGSGHFMTEFEPQYSAGAMVEASGFGEGIDGTWPSERLSTTWTKGTAPMTTIDVSSDPDKKAT